MKRVLNVLLVTALVAPLLALTGCGCCEKKKEECCVQETTCNDKCGTTYSK